MDILSLFCDIDDFCKVFEQVWQKRQPADGRRHRQRTIGLSQARVMTILVLYHASGYKNLTAFYLREIICRHHLDFRSLVSYNRFVELQQSYAIPLFFYLLMKRGDYTGVSFIDATSLKVCHKVRIPQNRTFCTFCGTDLLFVAREETVAEFEFQRPTTGFRLLIPIQN